MLFEIQNLYGLIFNYIRFFKDYFLKPYHIELNTKKTRNKMNFEYLIHSKNKINYYINGPN